MKRLLTTLIALTLFAAVAVGGGVSGLRLPWETTKKLSELTSGLGTGTVTSLGEGVMMDFSANPITTTGTIAFDTAAFKLWWTTGATAWDTFKIAAGWGILKTSSADTVTLTGDSATIHTWGNGFWLDDAYADTIQIARDTANAALAAAAKAQDTANAALARRDTLTAGWGIDLAAKPTGDDTVTMDSATVHTWGDAFWLDTLAPDTTAFHDSSLTDTSKVLFARVGNFDTTAGPATLNVAGNAWVRDTAWADLFLSYAVKPETTTNPNDDTTYRTITVDAVGGLKIERTQAGDDDKFSLQVGGFEWSPKAYLMKFAQTHSAGNDTDKVFTANGALGFLEYREANHLSLMNWDGFENVDTVHKDVSGNPARRAYNGFAWNDTGMTNDGCGFAGIWQYESTRVVAMAETASGGINSFVATVGSATGNFADTSYMSSTLGIYTNTAAGFVGVGAVVPGQIIDWYGDSSAFPTGYVLCDGTRKFKNAAGDSVVTPDLRNFFTVGASIDTGNGIPMSTIEDTTGTTAKATGGSQKYTPAGTNSGTTIESHENAEAQTGSGVPVATSVAHNVTAEPTFTGARAVLVQPYVACWKLVRSRTW